MSAYGSSCRESTPPHSKSLTCITVCNTMTHDSAGLGLSSKSIWFSTTFVSKTWWKRRECTNMYQKFGVASCLRTSHPRRAYRVKCSCHLHIANRSYPFSEKLPGMYHTKAFRGHRMFACVLDICKSQLGLPAAGSLVHLSLTRNLFMAESRASCWRSSCCQQQHNTQHRSFCHLAELVI